ncbi:MAG: hypothetical protein LKJ83_06740 [Eubacteriaceae bacterium]|jgi:hypothetical protein|nr:hypothetical protein [Eubacteriaceae bacterium]
MKRKVILPLLMAAALVLSVCALYPFSAEAEISDTHDDLGILVDGQGITKGSGFSKDFVYITLDGEKQMKASKNTAEAGLGDCWTDSRVFSSYDHHINSDPIYYYSIASGIDIKTMLANLGVKTGSVVKMKVEGSDSYAFTFDKPYIFSQRYYFAPGTSVKTGSVLPLIAFYKTTCGVKFTSEKGTVPSSAALVSDETNVFMYGQKTPEEDTNCRFIGGVDNIIVGTQKTVAGTANNSGKKLYFIDIARLGRWTDGNLTGVPLSQLMKRLGIANFAADSANKVVIKNLSGKVKAVISGEEANGAFAAWDYNDGTKASPKQTSRLMLVLQNGKKIYNFRTVSVLDSKGRIVRPGVPKVSATAGENAVLTWTAARYADGYAVYRSDNGDPYFRLVQLNGADQLTFTDKAARGRYKYKVRAFVQAGSTVNYGSCSKAAALEIK